MNYTYTIIETSEDSRVFEVESKRKLSKAELKDLKYRVEFKEGDSYSDSDSKVTFKGTDYGDDSQTQVYGDHIKEEDNKDG
tara:strand:+ start:167 stop:409 length:243 start_codon:yes stop_codon:yes gene_type:complete